MHTDATDGQSIPYRSLSAQEEMKSAFACAIVMEEKGFAPHVTSTGFLWRRRWEGRGGGRVGYSFCVHINIYSILRLYKKYSNKRQNSCFKYDRVTLPHSKNQNEFSRHKIFLIQHINTQFNMISFSLRSNVETVIHPVNLVDIGGPSFRKHCRVSFCPW